MALAQGIDPARSFSWIPVTKSESERLRVQSKVLTSTCYQAGQRRFDLHSASLHGIGGLALPLSLLMFSATSPQLWNTTLPRYRQVGEGANPRLDEASTLHVNTVIFNLKLDERRGLRFSG